jgi:threonine/homoserine/homoserine lactone efflux protein
MDFVPSLPVLAAYVAAVLVLTFTPGPDMTLFLGKALRQGRREGMASMFGAMTGSAIHTMLVALGLSALIAASATAFFVLKVVGALYLLWLAVDAVRNGSALNVDTSAVVQRESALAAWAKGLAVNLSNPKVIMFFVTFLPQFVSAGDPHATGKLIFLGLGTVVISAPICALMVAFAARLSSALKRSPRLMRAIDWLFAGVFGAFAVRLIAARQ